MVIGSTTDQVARESPVPVMVICHPGDQEDHKPAPVRRIIVPLDGSALSMHALPVAAEMARQYQLPVVLVRAIHAVDEKLPVAFDANAAARHAMAVDSSSLWWEAKTFLGAEAKTLRTRGIAATSKVVSGPAAAGISGIIEEGDMIIMTSHGESGVRRWILGSVAQMLLRAGVAPVVLVPSRQHSGVGTHEEPGVVKTLPDPAHLDI
jgi:nucleotide-binding universal stress UspA family protein